MRGICGCRGFPSSLGERARRDYRKVPTISSEADQEHPDDHSLRQAEYGASQDASMLPDLVDLARDRPAEQAKKKGLSTPCALFKPRYVDW